jgi:putative membrane protein
MKSLLQKLLINIISILVVAYIASGLSFGNSPKTLFIAALALAFANAILRPIIKLIFTPINLVTLGLFSWVINVLILYMVTLVVPGFNIQPFSLTLFGTVFVFNQFFAYIVISIALSLVTTATSWLIY